MLEVTNSRSEVNSVCWRLSWSNKVRNKHMNKGQSGTDTFWRQALFCTRVNWKALASLTKNIPGKKNCSKKLGPAPKEKERNDQAQILSLRKESFKIRKGQVIKDYKKAKYSNIQESKI